MLRIIKRCFGLIQTTTSNDTARETTVLVMRVPLHRSELNPLAVDSSPAQGPSKPAHSRSTAASSTGGVACVSLKRLGMFSPQVLRRLRRAGLRTAADLLAAEPDCLVQRMGAPDRWALRIRRCQRALRFSRGFSDMTPLEALILFAAHRRSRRRLAAESAGLLKRDLERLLLSSRGQMLAAGCSAPEIARVRLWIREARGVPPRGASASNVQVRGT